MSSGFALDRFLQYIPEIERRIRDNALDAIVWGIGPTAWLLPWMNPDLLKPLRKWTTHDGCRVMPANDLLLLDTACRGLHPDTARYRCIVDSRPDRIWVFKGAWDSFKAGPASEWRHHLHPDVQDRVRVQDFRVWDPRLPPQTINPKLGGTHPKTKEVVPDTCAISPAGACTLAWQEGCRRIGLIGVDMLPHHIHSSHQYRAQIDHFLSSIATRMHEAGGLLCNLSPITSLPRFSKWIPSASTSAPIAGNATPEPKTCSNTASASTQAVP